MLNYSFIDINECLTIGCLNGGLCNNFDGTWNCTCPSGLKGKRCGTGNILNAKLSGLS